MEGNSQDTAVKYRSNFKFALVRGISTSFPENCLIRFPRSPINLELANKQHAAYVDALKNFGLQIVRFPQSKDHADCVFTEDTCVVIGDTVVITNPGHPNRKGETAVIKQYYDACVAKTKLEGMPAVTSIKNVLQMVEPACCDGGDIIFTGRHLFIGISKRTNMQGAQFLMDAFKHLKIKAHPIELSHQNKLHLKCIVCPLTSDTLIVADTPEGKEAYEACNKFVDSKSKYKTVYVPDEINSNIVSIPKDGDPYTVKGVIIQKNYPESQKILRKALVDRGKGEEKHLVELDMSELVKGDGSLTCCSVLIQ